MKTKTTITVETWRSTAVRMKREPVAATCPVCGGDVNTLSTKAKHLCMGQVTEEAKNDRNKKRLIRLRPLDQK